jgi:hypothetical protein
VVAIVASWSAVVVLLSLFAAPHEAVVLSSSWRIATAVVFAACMAVGTSTARLSSAARAGRVVVDAVAPQWHPVLRAWGQGLVAAVLVIAVCFATRPTSWHALVVAGFVGVAVGAVVRVPVRASAKHRTAWRWVLEGAVPTAVVAAGLGVVVAATRFGFGGDHAAGAVSRALAGTFVFDALLAIGGFSRAFSEAKSGLVVSDVTALPAAPSPLLAALGVSAAVVLVGPVVLPTLSGSTVIAVKALGGAFVGGALSLIGAVRGARAAAGVGP